MEFGALSTDEPRTVRCVSCDAADQALADRALALSAVRHKTMFFPEKDAAGEQIDYHAAVSGGLRLVPTGSAPEVLADDYGRMAADGMLLVTDEAFERLIGQCAGIEARANRPEDDNGSAS